ncbi:unnamed protein product, partial [Iphiclides podalirius]
MPIRLHNRSWLELKIKDICKSTKTENNLDMMLGDQPIDAIKVGEETTALKSMPLVAKSDLEDGTVIKGTDLNEDDDSEQFLRVGRFTTSAPSNDIEGSGEGESTTISDIIEPIHNHKFLTNLLATEEVIPADKLHTTDDPIEGSGEGSGFYIPEYEDNTEKLPETTTPLYEDLNPGPVHKIFEDDSNIVTTEFPMPAPPTIFEGGSDWHSKNNPEVVTETIAAATPQITRDTTVSEQIRVTQASEVLGQIPANNENFAPHKTGTYICIALIVVLLVGLIGFAIMKGQIRKRRDRRLLRQQKRDVEKASKEMVDMNKSLLGKPAPISNPVDKKLNGKYELVPTHESVQKKSDNGEIGNGLRHREKNGIDSPTDSNQNKRSSIDNNLAEDNQVSQQETSFESDPASPESRKDTHSLSSEDLFVPLNDDDNTRLNGNADSDVSQPLINGDAITDADFLSPSREYVPVYSPDMGRVRIKMTETPKPKTPVLVTRSRSNAGDIIITPSEENTRKSTT